MQSAHLKFIIMKLASATQAAITYLQGTNYRIRIVKYEGDFLTCRALLMDCSPNTRSFWRLSIAIVDSDVRSVRLWVISQQGIVFQYWWSINCCWWEGEFILWAIYQKKNHLEDINWQLFNLSCERNPQQERECWNYSNNVHHEPAAQSWRRFCRWTLLHTSQIPWEISQSVTVQKISTKLYKNLTFDMMNKTWSLMVSNQANMSNFQMQIKIYP